MHNRRASPADGRPLKEAEKNAHSGALFAIHTNFVRTHSFRE
jgi:hypothetical protein